jgi:hypothetical protein
MSEISLQELDAQFSELLPEREALGCIKFSIPCHDYDPCQPHHHHHCEPKPCEPKPCEPQPAPCPPPHHHVPCDDNSWKGGHGGYGDPKGGHGGYGDPQGTPVKPVTLVTGSS